MLRRLKNKKVKPEERNASGRARLMYMITFAMLLVFCVAGPESSVSVSNQGTVYAASKQSAYNSKSGKKVVRKKGRYVYKSTGKTVKSDMVRIGKKLWYVKGGYTQKKKTGTVKVNKKWYYVKKGIAYTGKRKIKGTKYYYRDGVKLTGVYGGKYYRKGLLCTGMYKNKYYKNGVPYTGQVTVSGKVYSYKSGVKGKLYTGIYSGKYYRKGVPGTGIYDKKYYNEGVPATGLVKEGRYIYYYEKGALSTKGSVTVDKTYVLKSGKVTGIKSGSSTANGFVQTSDGKKYYVTGGKVLSGTGFVKAGSAFYYVEKGKLTSKSKVSGSVTYKSALSDSEKKEYTYTLSNGRLTGTAPVKTTDGNMYYVKDGAIVTGDTEIKTDDNIVFIIKDGVMSEAITVGLQENRKDSEWKAEKCANGVHKWWHQYIDEDTGEYVEGIEMLRGETYCNRCGARCFLDTPEESYIGEDGVTHVTKGATYKWDKDYCVTTSTGFKMHSGSHDAEYYISATYQCTVCGEKKTIDMGWECETPLGRGYDAHMYPPQSYTGTYDELKADIDTIVDNDDAQALTIETIYTLYKNGDSYVGTLTIEPIDGVDNLKDYYAWYCKNNGFSLKYPDDKKEYWKKIDEMFHSVDRAGIGVENCPSYYDILYNNPNSFLYDED